MNLRVLPKTAVPPATEPVTLSQLRGQVRVDDNVDDAMLFGYLIAAREAAETIMGRPIVPRPVVATCEGWPGTDWRSGLAHWSPLGLTSGQIELLMPVTSVDSITYASTNVAAQPWTAFVARTTQGGVTRIRPAAGTDWPALGDDPLVTISCTAGYTTVPEAIVTAILQIAAHYHANRESVIVSDGRAIVAEVPQTAASLLRSHRWSWVA